MSRKPKEKITTEHQNALSAENPFEALHLKNLSERPVPEPDATAPASPKTQSRGRVEVTREKSGRAGKTVTVLRAFEGSISLEELNALAFKLKKHCACGGSLKGRTIELQGDVCQTIMVELKKQNFKPVRSGG